MKRNIYNILWACGVGATLMMQSCSLEEVNPGEFSLEVLGSTPQGYEKLLNQCYFGLERQFYNGIDFMGFMEGNVQILCKRFSEPYFYRLNMECRLRWHWCMQYGY